MKVSIIILSALISVPAFADKPGLLKQVDRNISGQKYGLAGCGLGSIVIGGGKGMNQIFAATTNGTSGTQTFGISSGTSNCDSTAAMAQNKAADFAVSNRQQLEVDIARAQGESLAGLSAIMGCSNSSKVGQVLQSELKNIQASNDVEMGSKVVRTISESRDLSTICTL